MSSSVSVKDVAAAAGVSVGTVSNVLNRPDRVGAATRSRVESAIEKLGFVRNESARHLRAGASRTIGYLVLDAANPFFTDVARGVEEAARDAGLAVFLCNSDNSRQREHEYLELLFEQRVRGVLVTPVDPGGVGRAALPGIGVPVVLVDRTGGDDWCSVSVDDVYGGRLAGEYLVESGHERFAFVGGPDSIGQVQDRLSGFRGAVEGAGVLTELPTAALTVAEGRAAGQRLAGMPASRRPTAAFCANDLLALGLLQEMTRLRIRVPDDLAIVGYDDIEFAAAAAVPLTSVRQPRHQIGRTAAELLTEETTAHESGVEHQHRQVVYLPELIVRESTVRGS
ncbi:LacI family DNA-binding transcriptional regulator [Kineosporia mesophila]|uniref:LacI family DNA-binding transcriptional regulator n=1 Tax=Kineosporia mesophila TaxID=566012 RepID=UPI001E4B63E5|nr:LacI family DNA-binding transcriptional regulator [Kineosporia mesophila]MCD5351851.1 LacI family transcriptional regulator [Kineosporia mesophila]